MSKLRYFGGLLLRHYYFIIFFLPLGYVLHAFNEYQDAIPVAIYFRIQLRYIFLAGLVSVGVIFFFRKKPLNGAIISCVLLLIYFLFGSLHDWWRQETPGTLSSYKVILPIGLILFAALWYYLKRSPEKVGFHKYLKYLVLLSFLFEMGMGLVHLSTNKDANDLSGDRLSIQENCGKDRPDIFFVVWDEYPSSVSLRADLGFDNWVTDSLFRANGFYVVDSSFSNYNVTPFSLSATLDASYLRAGIEKQYDAKLFLLGLNTYRHSTVVEYFQSIGYDVRNYGRFSLENTSLATADYFEHMFEQAVNGNTFISRVERDLWWNVSLKNWFTGKFRVPKKYKKRRDQLLRDNQYTYESLMRELADSSAKPRFVLAHLMLPHDPYLYKKDGSLQPDSLLITRKLPARQGFLEQLEFTNKLLNRSISLARKKFNRDRVVVMQGDHGFRYYETEADSSKHFSNLNAIYFSDRDYSMLNRKMSSVNTFRLILNKYFCQDLLMLPDSTIYVSIPKG